MALDPPAPFLPMESTHPDSRILNITRNCRLKPHQAKARIDAGLAEWVDKGISIRDLDRKERLEWMMARKNHHIPDYLPGVEVSGCRFIPPETSKISMRDVMRLVVQARELFPKKPKKRVTRA